MSTRSVIVRLEAEVSRYVAGMSQAATATSSVARQVVATRQSVADNNQNMKDLGATYLKVGAMGVAGLGATAKAAMDWETAWAGVTKTVEGTPAQLAELEGGLRSLAKTLPASHTEIAGVAEAAGQLGVARKDVIGFTKTMIDLGVSTNLTAEDAATNIAQISNVMGTMEREGSEGVARFGAALVALGNDGASTEAEILSMAQRIAGAAATVGASETDVLALSNTLASMGVKAELGGGVTTRVLLKMYGAVQEGGDSLVAFAKTAGVSMDDFSKAFRESPVQAMDMVNKGLSRIKDEGGNVVEAMKDMGMKGTEEMQVMLALAASGDLLSDSLELGAKAWAENTALVEEAGKRYDTTASKIQIGWNRIKDAAIDAGAVLLPIISTVVETVSGLATAFGDLPAPVQAGIVVVASIAAGAMLLGGALLSVIPRIAETRDAIQALNSSGSSVPGTLGKIGKAAGIVGAALAIIGTAVKIGDTIWGEAARSAEEYGQALLRVDGNARDLDGMFSGIYDDVTGVGDALARLGKNDWADNMTIGIDRAMGTSMQGITKFQDSVDGLDTAMADMASRGNHEQVGKQFAMMAEEAKKSAEANGEQALSLDQMLDLFPQYKASLQAVASELDVNLSGQELLNFALGEMPASLTAATNGAAAMAEGVEATGVAIDGVVESMDKFLEQLFNAGIITMTARDANSAYHEAIRGVDEAIKTITESGGAMGAMLNENATDFDLSTQAGSTANAAFQDLAQRGMAEVEAKANEGLGQDQLQAKLSETYNDLVTAANGMGITGDAAINLARDVLGVPDNVDIHTWMDSQAKAVAEETKNSINGIPNGRTFTIYGNVDPSFRAAAQEAYALGQVKSAPGMNVNVESSGIGGGYSDGGPLYGPGTGTSDSFLIKGSKGEHMLTAAEVKMAGGHGAIYQLRSQIRQGNLPGSGAAAAAVPASVMYTPPQPLVMSGGGTPGETHHHTHIDASPGVAYQYAKDVAIKADARARDHQRAYGN